MSKVIVKFALFGLHDESSIWVHRVGDAIGSLQVDFSSLHFLVEQVLVVPGGLLLIHQATGGGGMLFAVCVVIEFTHNLVELVHLERVIT